MKLTVGAKVGAIFKIEDIKHILLNFYITSIIVI